MVVPVLAGASRESPGLGPCGREEDEGQVLTGILLEMRDAELGTWAHFWRAGVFGADPAPQEPVGAGLWLRPRRGDCDVARLVPVEAPPVVCVEGQGIRAA
jgi:hypothetical protein